MRDPCRFATLNAGNAGGVAGGKLERFVQALDCGAGQAYFECGQILEMDAAGTVVRAKVCGSQEYEVEIHRVNGRIEQMYCDCPYAEGGENCKHMAAVLVALENSSVKDWQVALDHMPGGEAAGFAAESCRRKKRIAGAYPAHGCRSRDKPEQWSTVFAQMLSDAEHPSDRMNLYYFEGMYTDLFTELCQCPSLGAFLNYEKGLRSWNPDRTRTYYTEILKREMDAACQRNHYRQIIRYLENLKVYPDGENAARRLAEYWYACHKNRPAMKDELLKAGYPQA